MNDVRYGNDTNDCEEILRGEADDINGDGVPDECVFFQRGDGNADGQTDVSDAVFILSYLFTGGPTPSCLDAADSNDSGGTAVDLSDPIHLLYFLFIGGPEPPAPFSVCGSDPTVDGDDLSCKAFPP